MGRIILFSPVGGTDPMSDENFRDGSLLHICRMYEPTDVVMYMSKEIIENQDKDGRYTYVLDKLSEKIGKKINYSIIREEDLVDVQDYNIFYREFENQINKIVKNMSVEDKLLLNVSSGTPAMKSALLVLQNLTDIDSISIQVVTPERKMNKKTEKKEYDVEKFWLDNPDNGENVENRCIEVECGNLLKIKNEEIIKKNIRSYNYNIAFEIANTMPDRCSRYIRLLNLADKREQLDEVSFKKVKKKINNKAVMIHFEPVEEEKQKKYFEYALNLDLKLRKKQYADFIRAITPIIVDLFDYIIRKQFKINIHDYTYINKKKVEKWNEKKLGYTNTGNEIKDLFNDEYKGFDYGFIRSDNLKVIINHYSNDEKLKICVSNLRRVEDKIRNLAAHDIVSITRGEIKQRTGMFPEEIMEQIKLAFTYTNINVEEELWDSFDTMNEYILSKIDEK